MLALEIAIAILTEIVQAWTIYQQELDEAAATARATARAKEFAGNCETCLAGMTDFFLENPDADDESASDAMFDIWVDCVPCAVDYARWNAESSSQWADEKEAQRQC